jgi:hypothetical protein
MPSQGDSGTLCPEVHHISPNETLTLGINFIPKLRPGALLSGTPTVTISPSDPTLANKQRNTASMVISGKTVAANKAVICSLSGCTVDTDYVVTAQCATDETPSQVVEATCIVKCRA